MREALSGDQGAYESLLGEIGAFLENFLGQWVRDAESRRDLAQEILLSLHASRASYDPKFDFKPWLFTLIHRRVIDFIRKKGRNREDAVLDTFFHSQPAELQSSLILNELIGMLNERERSILKRVYLSGEDEAKVAAELGVSIPNLRVMAHRLKKKLISKARE